MAPRPNTHEEVNMNGKRIFPEPDFGKPLKKLCGNKVMSVSTKRITRSPEPEGFSSKKTIKLFNAVEEGNLETVKEMIQETGPAVRKLGSHCTLLHIAAACNQTKVIVFLLRLINPNVVNNDHQTPAHMAAINGHIETLKILLADDDINPDIRDISQRTYKDLLSAPLFKAVLWWNKKQIEELLKLGADPDYHAGKLVDGALARELHVTTPRQLAKALGRQPIIHMFPEMRVPELSQHGFESCVNNQQISSDITLGPLRLKVKPALHPISGPDVYEMNTNSRGYVCILNYGSFQNRPDLDLEASKNDSQNLANVFGKMGYQKHVHSSLTLDETKDVLTNVRNMEILKEVGCAIFIISSHSSDGNSFLTSDMKHVTTDWILNLFKDSECHQLKDKPKLFIFDFCRGYYNQSNAESYRTMASARVQEPLQDMMCLYSSSSGFTSYSFSKDGSAFNTVLCRTLAQHSHEKEIHDIYRELLVQYRKMTSPSVVPQLRNIGFTKQFFFNPTRALST